MEAVAKKMTKKEVAALEKATKLESEKAAKKAEAEKKAAYQAAYEARRAANNAEVAARVRAGVDAAREKIEAGIAAEKAMWAEVDSREPGTQARHMDALRLRHYRMESLTLAQQSELAQAHCED